ncbi:TadE/TadG family type IV pilus assembly protein [Pimelobacter simplex]|uniref:TadE/TadG family type IV pilus assembly protein n=1 Tax=Nocardioides simplex TaxID=2045 RepID=UPI0019332AD7|nr:pilus assembly protein [Pimelobacter simplex]
MLRRRRATDRGAAAVEFALILFPLMLIVFGIVNYGDMLSVRQSVSQAASEGARAAAVEIDPAQRTTAAESARSAALNAQGQTCNSACEVVVDDCADATTLAKGALPAGGTSNSAADPIDCVWVKVEIDYDGLIPGFGPVLPDTLRYTAVARVS